MKIPNYLINTCRRHLVHMLGDHDETVTDAVEFLQTLDRAALEQCEEAVTTVEQLVLFMHNKYDR